MRRKKMFGQEKVQIIPKVHIFWEVLKISIFSIFTVKIIMRFLKNVVAFSENLKFFTYLTDSTKIFDEYLVYWLFFLRWIAQFFTQIHMNCFVSS